MSTTEENTAQKQAPSFEELVAMPIAEQEARVQLAELDIQLAQCEQQKAAVNARMADIQAIRAIVYRRLLNGTPTEQAADGDGE